MILGFECLGDYPERRAPGSKVSDAREGALLVEVGGPWAAQTHYDYARMLVACGKAIDRPRAIELTARCFELARELGMSELLRKGSVLQQRLEILRKPREAG